MVNSAHEGRSLESRSTKWSGGCSLLLILSALQTQPKSKIRQHMLIGHTGQLPTAQTQERQEGCLAVEGSGKAGL